MFLYCYNFDMFGICCEHFAGGLLTSGTWDGPGNSSQIIVL